MMRIANPIYDVVFKYLMQEQKIAKLMLSAIIGQEIEHIELKPQESSVKIEKESVKKIKKAKKEHYDTFFLTVFRIDFSARIKLSDGTSKQVIIEIQKAKFASDIMRFRKYLGAQYSNHENVEKIEVDNIERNKAIPIISIYFLGHKLDHSESPVIKVNRHYIDAATGEVIKEKEDFIESLTHDSIVIQIPYLKNKRRNDLEKLLSIFDQNSGIQKSHFLDIEEENYPKKYREVIRRLQKAIAEPQVITSMEVEDELLEELAAQVRAIQKQNKDIEEKNKDLKAKKKDIKEKEKILKEKDKTIKEKDKSIEEKEKTIEEKEKTIEEKEKTIENLLKELEALKNKNK